MSSSRPPYEGNPKALAPNDCCVPDPGYDGISSLKWSPTANILASGNWDGGIRFWEVHEQGGQIQAIPKVLVNHGQSVLDVCFSPDGSKLFSGGCDNAVRMYQLGKAPHISVRIGFHDKGVKGVGYIRSSNLVVSGGWDSKLKFWDQRQPQPVGVFELHERVYGLDVCDNLLVVATAGRHIITYDCSGQPREHSRIESPLAYQTRCLTSFPDSTGFAVGGIDGRVGIQYLSKDAAKENFAFFCHRQGSDVSAVNAIAFHVSEAYATVGADGGVNFWEKNSRSCLKSFDRIGRPVSCAAFNTKGDLFAYASSYDWSKGRAYAQSENEIFVHRVRDDEILPKSERAVGFKR